MQICHISDTHNQHNGLDMSKYPADVLVHTGDFSSGTATTTLNFLDWFEEQPYEYKILIAGNHDWRCENDKEWFKKALEYAPSVTYLENEEVTINDIKFYGSPYSNEFGGWSFMDGELELSKIWGNIPEDTDILMTHGPSYGYHDLVKRAYGRDPHVGSKSLTERKKELEGSLQYHLSGHIHEGYGISKAGLCTNVCASVLNENYELVNEPIILDIECLAQ